MTRPGKSGRGRMRSAARPDVEILEGRALPTGIGFLSALGVGATGTPASIRSDSVATDLAGDTYVSGSFRGTVDFDPGPSTTSYTTAGTQDAFVAKYGPTGALLWARTFAGQSTTVSGSTTYAVSEATTISVDGTGNVFVAGSFNGTINLTGVAGVSQATSVPASTEPFVAKLDGSGNVTWFDAVSGMAYDTDTSFSLALDGSGGAVFAGSFAESATFGPTTLTATGQSDAFVARVNSTGTFLWAVATRGVDGSNAVAQGVAVDASGNVDLDGFYSGSVDFDPSASTTTLTSAGSDDATLWKLDSNGRFLWARSYGSTDFDAANALGLDASGNLYATGNFTGTVNFGTVAKPDPITSGPTFSAYLLKVDSSGNEAWVKGLIGPSGSSNGQGVAIDPFGVVHVGGTFSGPVDFDPGPGTDTLTSVASSDAFLAGYDSNGSLVYALQAGQTNFNATLGVAVNALGIVAITGPYSGSPAFGPTTLPSFASGSLYVARANTQVPPPAASSPVLEAASDTGLSQTDGITSVRSPALDVNTAIANATVELLRNGVIVAQRTGPGALSDPGPLADGTYLYTAVQISQAGSTGPASGGTAVTILTVPPAQLPAPALLAADDSGTLGDGITNVRQPRLTVVAKGATTVQLLDSSNNLLGSIYQAADGISIITLNRVLTDGVYPIRARAVDVAGNVGTAGPASSLTIDTTAPAAPPAPTLLAADDSGTVGDNLTNVRQPRLTGHAEANSTVRIVNGQGVVYGMATAASDGSYTAMISTSLADGTYLFSARATDAAGNQGVAGPSLTLVILATPPPAPSTPSILAADDSGTVGDNLTNVRQPRIIGSAQKGATVNLITGSGAILASAMAGSDGSYTAKITSPLSDGPVTLYAIAIDPAGNRSPTSPTLTITIDTTPPATPPAPSLLLADDSGSVGDGITNVRQPRLSGTAEPGSTVQIVNAMGTAYGSAVAAGDGRYTAKLTTSLADGLYALAARATDAAGNQGAAGSTFSLVILTTGPSTPAAPSLLAADATGGPALTNVRQPRLTGKTAANATVQLYLASGSLIASTTSAADGSYLAKVTTPLADGTYSIHAIATDVAGNASPAGSIFSLTILATPPASPSAPTLLAADDSGTLGDRITNVRQARLTGTSTAGLTIQLVNASNQVLGTVTVPSGGAFTVMPSSPLADGTYALSFVALDPAGNVSTPGASLSLTILATAPPQPVAPSLLASDDTGVLKDGMTSVRRPRIVGTATPGGKVDWLSSSGAVLATTTASTSGGSYQLQPPSALPNGMISVRVRVTDVAGNVSPISPAFNLTERAALGDYFGDSRSDFSVYRPSDSVFLVQKPTTGALFMQQFGGSGDVPINGDFFGNGHNDIALYRPSSSTFYILDPVANLVKAVSFGQVGDIPAPGDYDGDGQADLAIYRPSTSTFYILKSATNTIYTQQFGGPGDVPIPADYFGNGHSDVAIYRTSNSTFYILDPITGQTKVVTVGTTGGTPVPADYEGIGQADPAVYITGSSTFVIQMSTNKTYIQQFGGVGDIPAIGDYFGAGRADITVYRLSNATFYAADIITSTPQVFTWGTPNTTLPTLAPITLWFSFGGGGGGSAGRSAIGPRNGSVPAIVPLTTEVGITVGLASPKATIRSSPSLSLESWRPTS